MKAGNGIIHDEGIPLSIQRTGGLLHVLQFWIKLTAKNKNDEPDYIALQAAEMPELILPDDAGKLRILIGTYGSAGTNAKYSKFILV